MFSNFVDAIEPVELVESATRENALTFIGRHSRGDWGDVDSHDRQANETALEDGSRIWSVYHLKDGTKIWVITEAESI